MQCHRIYFRFSSLPRPVCHAAASLPAHRDLARGGDNTKPHLLPEYSRSPLPHPRMSGGSGPLPYSMPEVDGVKSVSDNDVHNIVLSYLMHNCYKETAETFLSSTGLKLPVDYSVDVDKRKAIYNFVLEGNALKAIELTEELAPTLLENDMDLHFDLLSLHFIDLVRSRKCTEALEFGQKKLTLFGKVPKYVEKLEEFMALLAYEEPEKSPTFHLLSPEYRQNVADSLNRVALAHANLPAYSTLERVIQQVTVVRQYLEQEFDKDSYPPFSLKAFLNK